MIKKKKNRTKGLWAAQWGCMIMVQFGDSLRKRSVVQIFIRSSYWFYENENSRRFMGPTTTALLHSQPSDIYDDDDDE